MTAVRIRELLPIRVLVTRQSARSLKAALHAALAAGGGTLELDFAGIEGVTPSFVDELLRVIEESLADSGGLPVSVLVSNPPTRLSSKFAAVGRGRGLSIAEGDNGTWVITPS